MIASSRSGGASAMHEADGRRGKRSPHLGGDAVDELGFAAQQHVQEPRAQVPARPVQRVVLLEGEAGESDDAR